MNKAIGWALWNGDKCKGFDSTKRGLFIGYDLIDLVGLRKCERRLAAKGWIPRRTRLIVSEETPGTGYAPVVHGKPSAAMVAWGAHCNTVEGALRSTAGYIGTNTAFGVTSDEAKTLRRYWFALSTDAKRRPVSHARLRSECAEILERLGISILPVQCEVIQGNTSPAPGIEAGGTK